MSNIAIQQVDLPYLSAPAHWATLENGHQIFTVNKPGDVVNVQTLVRTGSINETDENTGVSHFLEHLMFKGTERYPAGAFDRLLEGIGGRVNAGTSKDFTQYHITLPKGESGEYYRLALDLHADMMLHATLPAEEIGPPFDPNNPQVSEKRERMVVIEEIKRGKDNPWRQAVQSLTELLYPTHPYRREVIGTAEVIATIPRTSIEHYYRTWYQPANMVTIVTGDLDPLATIHDVQQNFHFHAVLPVEHPVYSPELPPSSPRFTHVTMPLNVAYAVLGFLGPSSADLKASIAIDVLMMVLGSGKSSRFQMRLIEQLPNTPFIEAESAHWVLRDSSNIFSFGILRPDATQQGFELLCREVQNLLTEPPTFDEVDKAVTRLETSFAAQAESAAGISDAIADSMARVNNPSNYTDYLPTLRSITREDLVEYAARYLAADQLCAVTVSAEGGEG